MGDHVSCRGCWLTYQPISKLNVSWHIGRYISRVLVECGMTVGRELAPVVQKLDSSIHQINYCYPAITHISCVRYQIDQLQNSGLFSCMGWHLSCLSVNISVTILVEYGRALSLARVSQYTDQHVTTDSPPRLDQDLSKTQPTLDQNSDWYVDWKSTQMLADISVNTLYKTHDPKWVGWAIGNKTCYGEGQKMPCFLDNTYKNKNCCWLGQVSSSRSENTYPGMLATSLCTMLGILLLSKLFWSHELCHDNVILKDWYSEQ